MPLYNWRKCQEREELQYCRKDLEVGSDKEDAEAWDVVYDTFLGEFGLGKDYERILEIQIELAELRCDFIIEDDPFLKNMIKRLEHELQELMDRPVENDMDAVIIHIENWRKIEVNEHTTTVRKFYKLLREYQKEAERMKKAG